MPAHTIRAMPRIASTRLACSRIFVICRLLGVAGYLHPPRAERVPWVGQGYRTQQHQPGDYGSDSRPPPPSCAANSAGFLLPVVVLPSTCGDLNTLMRGLQEAMQKSFFYRSTTTASRHLAWQASTTPLARSVTSSASSASITTLPDRTRVLHWPHTAARQS